MEVASASVRQASVNSHLLKPRHVGICGISTKQNVVVLKWNHAGMQVVKTLILALSLLVVVHDAVQNRVRLYVRQLVPVPMQALALLLARRVLNSRSLEIRAWLIKHV